MVYTEKGEIDLTRTPFLEEDSSNKSSPKGYFTDKYIILTDGTIYVLKYLISSKSEDIEESSKYAAIIASGIADLLGISSADYYLFKLPNKGRKTHNYDQYRLGSKFFLGPNEELLNPLTNQSEDILISEALEDIEKALRLRKYSQEEINEIKREFLKQEFLAKLIGLQDQKGSNFGLIDSTEIYGQRVKKRIRIAPMFDLDISFMYADKYNTPVRKCDNNQTDIASLIDQYWDDPEFMDFVRRSISNLDMDKVYKYLFKKTSLKIFSQGNKNPILSRYSAFVNRNINSAKEIVEEIDRTNHVEEERL